MASCINNCQGIEKCSKYCILHAGNALSNLLTGVTMIETRIGQYGSLEAGGKQDLVVSGHQVQDLKCPAWTYTSIATTTLDDSPKFNSLFGLSPAQLIGEYYKYLGMKSDEIQDVVGIIQRLNSNKLLILPFKPQTECTIDIHIENYSATKEGKIYSVRWATDPDTFKLKCFIHFTVNSQSNRTYEIPITEYLKRFRITSMHKQGKGRKEDSEIIKVTDSGIFKPIEFVDGDHRVAIDGTYVYDTSNGEIRIVAEWVNDEISINKKLKSKAYKKLRDNLETIIAHKRYIGPYKLFEANTIEL